MTYASFFWASAHASLTLECSQMGGTYISVPCLPYPWRLRSRAEACYRSERSARESAALPLGEEHCNRHVNKRSFLRGHLQVQPSEVLRT